MNECWKFFRFAEISDTDMIINIFKDKEVIGEITLVIKGICQEKYQKLDEADLKRDLRELINAGLSLSAASKYLAKKNDVKKSIIYNLNLRLDKS